MARDFTKIRAWKLADELALEAYRITKHYPSEETFGMAAQLRRAAYSVPANIAEGSNRASKREYLQFLSVAAGSLSEVRYFLHLSKHLKYLNEPEYKYIQQQAEIVSKTLTGLIRSVRSEISPGNPSPRVGIRRSERRGPKSEVRTQRSEV